MSLRIGPLNLDVPVVLAPMAGVTNAPFRQLCRRYGAGLYVSEMIMARALVEGGMKTWQRTNFAPGESPRSMQLYGTDPAVLGQAVRMLCSEGVVDHIDMNFGCPAAKVTRKGGGSAVPAKPRLLRRIVRAAVEAATPYNIPITMKFRKGLWDDQLNFVETGRIGEDEGVAMVALHARTTEQFYSGEADWAAIAALKEAVTTIPVLGNGDIWEADDARVMMEKTGCDGVVIGRGCLGRPWLFADLVSVLRGGSAAPAPLLGPVLDVMCEHAQLLCEWYGPKQGIRDFRKHTSWYLTGYPVGPALRRSLGLVTSLEEVHELTAPFDRSIALVPGGERIARGHTNGPRPVHLPHRYLEQLDDDAIPEGADLVVSGG
jgi:nifR3 family TIM-barrel protein